MCFPYLAQIVASLFNHEMKNNSLDEKQSHLGLTNICTFIFFIDLFLVGSKFKISSKEQNPTDASI